RRRVAPRQVLVVQLHEREVVGLEVAVPMRRPGAHDGVGQQPDRVARPEQLEVLVEWVPVDVDVDRHGRALGDRAVARAEQLDLVDPRPDPAAQPGGEGVAADGDAHAIASSCWATTCSVPASAGEPATSASCSAYASASVAAAGPCGERSETFTTWKP